MEKIEFKSNLEFVQKARELLDHPDGYEYGWNGHTCVYRTDDGKRCIFGRLMFGYIPEDDEFWEYEGTASDVFHNYPVFHEKFPFLSSSLCNDVQLRHDNDTGLLDGTGTAIPSWESLERYARKYDASYALRVLGARLTWNRDSFMFKTGKGPDPGAWPGDTFFYAELVEPVEFKEWNGQHPVEENYSRVWIAPPGTKVMVTVLSRFGDVGIRARNLDELKHGYDARVDPETLTNWVKA